MDTSSGLGTPKIQLPSSVCLGIQRLRCEHRAAYSCCVQETLPSLNQPGWSSCCPYGLHLIPFSANMVVSEVAEVMSIYIHFLSTFVSCFTHTHFYISPPVLPTPPWLWRQGLATLRLHKPLGITGLSNCWWERSEASTGSKRGAPYQLRLPRKEPLKIPETPHKKSLHPMRALRMYCDSEQHRSVVELLFFRYWKLQYSTSTGPDLLPGLPGKLGHEVQKAICAGCSRNLVKCSSFQPPTYGHWRREYTVDR